MLRVVCFVLIFVQLTAFSESLLASSSQIEWSLQLGECGAIHVNPVTTVLMSRDSESWTKATEHIVISVIQPSWNYHFFGLGVGSEFVVQGDIYKLSSIHDDAFHRVIAKVHGCTPAGNVTVTKTGRSVSGQGSDSVILSRASTDTIYAGSGSCSAKIKLNSLIHAQDGSYAADIEWHELSPTPKDPSCNRASPVLEHQVVKIGGIIQTKGYGGLRVESIWPESAVHSDWIVLTAER